MGIQSTTTWDRLKNPESPIQTVTGKVTLLLLPTDKLFLQATGNIYFNL